MKNNTEKSKKVEGLGGLPQGNIFEPIPDFTSVLHRRENNIESQKHLEENEQKFVGQCAIVLSLLRKGVVLSSYIAMTQYRIGHLPRRLKDLRDGGDIHIDEMFEMDSKGKATRNKLWYMYDKLTEATKLKYKIAHQKTVKQ